MTSLKIRVYSAGRGKERPEVKTVCAECSAAITPDAKFCVSCHAPIVRRYCPGCSKLVPENTANCPFCGVAATAPAKHASNIPVILFAGLVAFGLTSLVLRQTKQPAGQDTMLTAPAIPASVNPAVLRSAAQAMQAAVPAARSLELRSDEEGARLNLQGYRMIQQNRYEEAIVVLRRALKTFPENTSSVAYKYALYNLGHSLRRTGNFQEAIHYLEQVVKIDSEWSKAISELGVARAEAAGVRPIVSASSNAGR